MLASIRDFFKQAIEPTDRDQGPDEHRLHLATAALMLELSRVDGEVSADEEAALREALGTRFGLSGEEIETLITLAEHEAREASGDYAFTSLINKGFNAEQKVRIIEHMWQIAYADGRVDAHENHFMRKLASLLYVSRADYVAAKQRARPEGQ